MFLISPAYAETLVGVLVGVSDGGTITVLDSERHQHKVRLGGIDAPGKAFPRHLAIAPFSKLPLEH